MNRWLLGVLSAVMAMMSLSAVLALQTQPTPTRVDITGVNPNDGRTTFVTVTVTDDSGRAIDGLTAEDFVLSGAWARDGGARIVEAQRVLADNLPLAVVLVVDTSSSMAGAPLDAAKAAARTFVESLNPEDSVALVGFNDDATLIQDYTTDRAQVLAQIDALPFGGQTALYDAGVAGVELAADAPYPRRAVVLLSDGAEFGGASGSGRGAGREAAALRGVPVYSIGLGYGIDRSYLRELADASNGRFYESPTPDDLAAIYDDIGRLFRSEYVLTVAFDGALDGRIYPFVVGTQAAPNVVDASTFRAPIPVPVVRVTPDLSAPLAGPTTFGVQVRADSPIERVTASYDSTTVELQPPYSLTIDPFELAPGDYTLTVEAVDTDGDAGTVSVPFMVDASQARLSLDVDLAGLGAISAPVMLTLDGETQSPVTGVSVRVDGQTVAEAPSLPAEVTFDPLTLTPGARTVEFIVTEQSGTESVLAQSLEVAALPPTLSIDGLAEGDLIDAARTVAVTLGGQSASGTVEVLVDGQTVQVAEGESPVALTLEPLAWFASAGAQTVTLTATNAFGQSASVEVPVTVAESVFPTPTPTITPSPTPDQTQTAAALTAIAQATNDQATAFFRATEDANATAAAQAVLDAQATSDARATGTAQAEFADSALATAEALATNEMQSTIDAELAQLAAFTATPA
ncbi:MAG: VWA domain-containing protein [Anaerolineae bacterium]|nr:VWA domain-containing protein [Anaerolineae bacterium]